MACNVSKRSGNCLFQSGVHIGGRGLDVGTWKGFVASVHDRMMSKSSYRVCFLWTTSARGYAHDAILPRRCGCSTCCCGCCHPQVHFLIATIPIHCNDYSMLLPWLRLPITATAATACLRFAAVSTVVRSCCSDMLPCVCMLRFVSFFLCIPITAVCSPKFCPVGWCLHTFGTRTSCVKTQEFARTCVYVCAHIHTSMACVCKSSSAERRAVQAGSEHSSALTSACTPSSGNGMLRRRAGAVVKALRTCIKVAST